jgi:hypothetical protein
MTDGSQIPTRLSDRLPQPQQGRRRRPPVAARNT